MRGQGALRIVVAALVLTAAAADVAWAREVGKKAPAEASAGPPAVPAPAKAGLAARRLGQAHEAFRAGDYLAAEKAAVAALATPGLVNRDYALYVAAQAAFHDGAYARARRRFDELARLADSRFAGIAPWRAADCLWELGQDAAAAAAYKKLLGKPGGDPAVARFRLAEILARAGKDRAAADAFRALAVEHPQHPLADTALARIAALGGPGLSARERISRAAELTRARDWEKALVELSWVGDDEPADVLRLRDFHLGHTLFKMRRQYGRAGEILLGVHDQMGALAPYALFHGARGLSRGDRDDEAIKWYAEVVRKYPTSEWAAEAQFLSGWLEYNRGDFKACIPGLEGLLARYPASKFADDALWYLGFSYYLIGETERALPLLAKLARQGGELVGGKGRYWHARALMKLGRVDEAQAELRSIPALYPISWYAILARARLAEDKILVQPFGEAGEAEAPTEPAEADDAPLLAVPDARLAKDPLIARYDELLAAGLPLEAGFELERGEKAFIRKHKPGRALPVLFERYARADNFNRPWALAEGYGRRALRQKPEGPARVWWQAHYPRAFRAFVDTYAPLGQNPPLWLYAIMYKESGFDPHVVSYADALGLMQMIPPTTIRVAAALGITYTEDLLFDPEQNVRVGSWYIGRLFAKFKQQVPLAAGSYNGGPRPMMKWLRRYGARPVDEFVELVSFTQTREYMKRVTGIYARYLWLYEGVDYQQPLGLDAAYLENDINY